jgi:hypothetical protein
MYRYHKCQVKNVKVDNDESSLTLTKTKKKSSLKFIKNCVYCNAMEGTPIDLWRSI